MNANASSDVHVGGHAVAGYPPVDFEGFHAHELPRRLRDGANERVHWDVRGAPPIAIRLAGSSLAFSYLATSDDVRIVRGVVGDAEVVLEIPDVAWQDYVYEMRTRFGLLYSGAVKFERGTFEQWDAWEPAIRCLYSGRPIYDPKSVQFLDLDGSPLDFKRRFTLDDSLQSMRHFLQTTGYLVVERAFTDRLAALSDEIDRLRDEAREGEVWSWWASDQTGWRFPYRLLYTGLRSELIASLDDDPQLLNLARLGGENLVPIRDRIEGHLAVLKPFGAGAVVDNFANLPWHKDCGLGGCPLSCPAVNVGIQLDAANAQSSQLWMMAGSWGKVCHDRPTEAELAELPVVRLETEPGDVTVHITCGLHAGPPPTGPNPRRTLYMPFYASRIKELLQPMQGFQQLIPNWGSGVVLNEGELQQTYY
jgi:hypothetical protein